MWEREGKTAGKKKKANIQDLHSIFNVIFKYITAKLS